MKYLFATVARCGLGTALCGLAGSFTAVAQAPAYQRIDHFRCSGSVNSVAITQLVIDATGNYYVGGLLDAPTRYPLVVRIGSAGDSLNLGTTSGMGTARIFVAKLSAAGRLMWGAATNSVASGLTGLALDPSGNVTIVGQFSGSINVGSTYLSNDTHAPFREGFVARLNAAGQWQWAKRAGGTSGSQHIAEGVAVDATGNIAVLATAHDTPFDPASGTTPGTVRTAFVVQFDAAGQLVRATPVAAPAGARGRSIARTPAGDLLLTGSFNSPSAQFGTMTLTGQGGKDIFVAKLNATGQWLWATGAGGSGQDEGTAIACNAAGAVAVAGTIEGATTLGNGGPHDVVVAGIDDVTGQWLGNYPTNSPDAVATAIAVAPNGSAQVTYNADVAAAFLTQTLPNLGGSDGYVGSLYPTGSTPAPWALAIGATGNDNLRAVASPVVGLTLVAGTFEGASLTIGSQTLTNPGGTDAFVAHLTTPLGLAPDAGAEPGVELWPNPAHDVVHFIFPSVTAKAPPARIIDALGRTVRMFPITSGRVTISGLPAGLYSVQCGAKARRFAVE